MLPDPAPRGVVEGPFRYRVPPGLSGRNPAAREEEYVQPAGVARATEAVAAAKMATSTGLAVFAPFLRRLPSRWRRPPARQWQGPTS